MTIMDERLVLADASVLTGIAQDATEIVGSVLDLGAGKSAFGNAQTPNIGEGNNACLTLVCTGADFASAGTPVLTAALVSADDAALSANPVTLVSFPLAADASVGDILFRGAVPKGVTRRYLGIKVTAADAALSAGAVTGWIDAEAPTPVDLK
jgi:hypothetical protein